MAGWTIVADDLTGACDTGAVFAQAGFPTRVLLDPAYMEGSLGIAEKGVLVVTTESRHLPDGEAARSVERALSGLPRVSNGQIYKKIDSTLRGQPGSELAALMRSLKLERALVAPAFPAQGRTVRDGHLLVNGARLEETVFGGEARSGALAEVFAAAGPVHLLGLVDIRRGADWVAGRLAGQGVWLADAEADDDLHILAEASRQSGLRLLCGSAGLARAAAALAAEGTVWGLSGIVNEPIANLNPVGPVLVVSGSRHPATQGQIAAAERAGLRLCRPSLSDLRIADRTASYAAALAGVMTAGYSLVLSAEGLTSALGEEAQVARELAGLACAALARVRAAGGLVLTGGDIAAAVLRELDCRAIDLGGEIQPGLGWGRLVGGHRPGLAVATKAGGFGGEDALAAAVAFLKGGEKDGIS